MITVVSRSVSEKRDLWIMSTCTQLFRAFDTLPMNVRVCSLKWLRSIIDEKLAEEAAIKAAGGG